MMNRDRLASLLLEVLILGAVLTLLLISYKKPNPHIVHMPQTITHTTGSAEIATPRHAGESLESWMDRHTAAIAAVESL